MFFLSRIVQCAAVIVALMAAADAWSGDAYAPTVGDAFPDTVYWGDTHLHTYLSADAFGMGNRTTPETAYRFAKGEEVTSTGGERVRLRRPLDFIMISDHAENIGILPRLIAGDEQLLAGPDGPAAVAFFAEAPPLDRVLNARDLEAFKTLSETLMQGKAAALNGEHGIDEAFRRQVWHAVIEVAERHNDPGTFTTFAGYGYSSNPPMLHRNVLFAGGPESTRQTMPFSKWDSANPEDLWAYLAKYEALTGSGVIAIPHNSNLSRGRMFARQNHAGDPMTADYAALRVEREPVVEVTQMKGDSETHPIASPDDSYADFETWSGANFDKSDTSDAWVTSSYVRPALKRGLGLEAELGVNPFKFGLIRQPQRPRHRRQRQLLGQVRGQRTEPLPGPDQYDLHRIRLRRGVGRSQHPRCAVRRVQAARGLRDHRAAHRAAFLRRLGLHRRRRRPARLRRRRLSPGCAHGRRPRRNRSGQISAFPNSRGQRPRWGQPGPHPGGQGVAYQRW